MTAATTEQRRRNLENRIREAETRRSILEEKILAGGTTALPEWAQELAMVESELADARQELDGITGGSAREQSAMRAILILDRELAKIETVTHRLELTANRMDTTIARVDTTLGQVVRSGQTHAAWLLVLTIWLTLVTAGLAVLGAQIWRITDLWR